MKIFLSIVMIATGVFLFGCQSSPHSEDHPKVDVGSEFPEPADTVDLIKRSD